MILIFELFVYFKKDSTSKLIKVQNFDNNQLLDLQCTKHVPTQNVVWTVWSPQTQGNM